MNLQIITGFDGAAAPADFTAGMKFEFKNLSEIFWHRSHAGRWINLLLLGSSAMLQVNSGRAQSITSYQWLNVKSCGAIGDGKTDDTNAILSAINAAKLLPAPAALYFPSGIYSYSKPIRVDNIAIYGAGVDQTILQASDVNYSSWTLSGNLPSIHDLTLCTSKQPTARNSNGNSVGIILYQANGFLIQRVRVGPVAGSGILVQQSSGTSAKHGFIRDSTINHTLADGIHVTGGSSNIDIIGNDVSDTGDDFIAVVSNRSSGLCSGINISNNIASTQSNGRGITVVGGSNVIIQNNEIADAMGAGIYLASETAYDTLGVANIVIANNTLQNVASSTANHGAIHLFGRYDATTKSTYGIQSIAIQDNRINGAGRCGILIGAYASSITVTGNEISNVNAHGISIGPYSANVTISADSGGGATNQIQLTGQYGIQVDPTNCTGTLSITGTLFKSINTSNLGYIDVINIGRGGAFSAVTVTGNHLEQPTNLHIERFVESQLGLTGVTLNTANISISSISP